MVVNLACMVDMSILLRIWSVVGQYFVLVLAGRHFPSNNTFTYSAKRVFISFVLEMLSSFTFFLIYAARRLSIGITESAACQNPNETLSTHATTALILVMINDM